MQTLTDPTQINHRECYVPDLRDRRTIHRVQSPGGCTCGKNHAYPHYRACIHASLMRSGAPMDDVRPGMLADGTLVYTLASRDTYYTHKTHGYPKGLWEHTLAFDGRSFYKISRERDTKRTMTVVLDSYRQF